MRLIGPIVFVLILLSMFLFTRDLKQINDPTLFLDERAVSLLNTFKQEISERPLLVLRLKYQNLDQSYDSFFEHVKSLEVNFPAHSFKTIQTLYGNKSLNELTKMLGERKLNIKLMDRESLSFLVHVDESLGAAEVSRLVDAIKNVKWGGDLSIVGTPYVNYLLNFYSKEIQSKLFPLVFVISFFLLWFFLGKSTLALSVFIPSLFSLAMTLTLIKILYHNMNMVTSITPMAIFVTSLSISLHILFSTSPKRSLFETLAKKIKPIMMMSVTTMVGFGSLYLSPMNVVKQFALLTVLSLILSLVATMVWFQLIHTYIRSVELPERITTLFCQLSKMSLSFRWIFALMVFVGVLSFYFIPKFKVLTDATHYFPKSIGFRTNSETIATSVIGTPLYEIKIHVNDNKFESYQAIKRVEDSIDALGFQTLSNNKIVSEVNSFYQGLFEIPDNESAYFLLRSKASLELLESYPVDDFYRLTVLGVEISVSDYFQKLKEIEQVLKNANLTYEVNGLYYSIMMAQEGLMKTLFYSFISSLVLILFLATLFWPNYRFFIIFSMINITPILLTGALLSMFGVTINVATVMTLSISLGMVVDSSFHITHAKQHDGKPSELYPPIWISALILIISFAFFGLNGFLPIRHFGITISISLLIGHLFDIYVLPTLLLFVRDKNEV